MNNKIEINNSDYTLLNFKLGSVFLSDQYVITHFNEGIDISYDNFYEIGIAIKSHFKGQPFGYIANRENAYSINLNDAHHFNEAFPNLKAYAVVCNSLFGKGVFEIENHFFESNRRIFKDLDEAINWTKDILNSIT
ncbi:MAG: hypothetical protein ED556_06635 [Winogradskyella sp.]|uniref:hypothetical protein n=1 Tax=Winogradskyella sp. TaxID=1883156 RepID=UPI000F4124B2|nr:hypothetical protein [Winogradskyella sp.]RNC87096.1 MAG: hypothetical protein ED556_06635 [Winogradskyella sp.]